MKVLVTGGSGFIGSALCKRLLDGGNQVTSLDNGSRNESLVEGVGYIQSDIRTPPVECAEGLRIDGLESTKECEHSELEVELEGGYGAVIHLAAINGTANFYSRPAEVLDVQIRGTINVLDACVRHGVRTLVLFSSSEVYQTPPIIPTPEDVGLSIPDITNPRYSYAVGKIAAEAMAWHSAIERVVVVRPHNVYAGGMGYDHVIPQFILRAARTPDGGTFDILGQSTRSFIYIDDFVDAMMAIWKSVEAREGRVREIFHVGTEDQVSMSALAGYVSDIMGKKGPRGYAYRFASKPGPVGGTSARCPDIRKVRALGWEPKVSLREGLERTVKAYLEKREEWPE